MRFELRDMQAKLGITSIFVTHDQAEAMSLSDRIVVMNVGRIEQEGSPEEVYQRPSTRFVMDFLGRANHLPARIAKGEVGSLVAEVEGSAASLPVAGTGSWSVGQEVLLAFRPEAVQARAADRDGPWVGVVRSSVYVSGHVEYVVEMGEFTVRATGPEEARLPHEARAQLCVSPRAVRVWPTGLDANGGTAR
jgi:ABC-type Fe3+/spermidine/putrescine transport system ATPase subunit